MFDRFRLGTLLLGCLVVPFIGCGSATGVDSIAVTPATVTLPGVGLTAQLTATATINHGSHPATYEDVTDQVTWSTSSKNFATVSTSGLVTSIGPGTAQIKASMNGFTGVVSSSATVTVTVSGSGGTNGEPLVSIAIVPTSLTTDNLLGTGQFLAYGTFSTVPTLMDISNGFYHADFPTPSCTAALAATGTSPCTLVPVTWISAAPNIFPVSSGGAAGSNGGLVTAFGSGNAVIYAQSTNPDGTLVNSPTVTFNCPLALPSGSGATFNPGTCNEDTIASGLLVTLTVYNAGLNTTNWLVTAPSATGTPDVIHCGPGSTSGGSVCTATYPVGTTVTLTAPAQAGVSFGGWSWNCENQGTVTAAGPNTCTVYLGEIDPDTGIYMSNQSVGAIFN